MNPITYAQLTAGGLFDRAALMPRPPRLRPNPGAFRRLRLHQVATLGSIHPQLPPTRAWTYEGLLPGPVVVVDAGDEVWTRHENNLTGALPYAHVVVDEALGGTMNDPGREGASTAPADLAEADHAADLRGHTVVHLHGAPTSPDSDGWAENVIAPGDSRACAYVFDREQWDLHGPGGMTSYRSGAGPTYWYHDHAMGATRFNVYAGLAGLWLVRDPVEAALKLPVTADREIPLVIADRNLDTVDGTATGALSGAVLHKVQVGVREHFGPVTLVNGLAWPRCRVTRRVHRLRLVNGSNARVYRLHFFGAGGSDDTGEPLPAPMLCQIGTDGGLLGQPAPVNGGLVLAPGERADLLVDFGLVAGAGFDRVIVYNSAPAPFQGTPVQSLAEITTPDPDGFRPIPQVMRFDLLPGQAKPGIEGRPITGLGLDPDFRRLPTDHALWPADHEHMVVALREEDIVVRDDAGQPVRDSNGAVVTQTMLFLHELAPEPVATARGCNLHTQLVDAVDSTGSLVQVPAGIALSLPDLPGVRLVTVGKRFGDTSLAAISQGSWALWKIVNLSPDTHPFHVHLTQFQALTRRYLVPHDPAPQPSVTYAVPKAATEWVFDSAVPGVLEVNETGWKDTIRVNPGGRDADDNVVTAELVTIAGCFARHAGRYMYHCHILEHEDVEMMRPFTVVPPSLMAFMTGHHH